MNNKKIWPIIEEVLQDLDFSEESITKVKSDLEDLAKAEATTQLLEELTEEQRDQLKNRLTNKQGVKEEVIIQNYLTEVCKQEKITDQLFLSTKNIITDYLEYLFNKVSDKRKKQILANLIPQV